MAVDVTYRSAWRLRRPVPFPSKRAGRTALVAADAHAGWPIGDTIEHVVPRKWLAAITGKHALERDLLNLVTLPRSLNCSRGASKVGTVFVPPKHLRGAYARAATYVAEIGETAAEIVDTEVIDRELAREWDSEYPATLRERERHAILADVQGRYVLRESHGGVHVWGQYARGRSYEHIM